MKIHYLFFFLFVYSLAIFFSHEVGQRYRGGLFANLQEVVDYDTFYLHEFWGNIEK